MHYLNAVIIKNKLKYYKTFNIRQNFLKATYIIIEDIRGFITISAIYYPLMHNILEKQSTKFCNQLGNKLLQVGLHKCIDNGYLVLENKILLAYFNIIF